MVEAPTSARQDVPEPRLPGQRPPEQPGARPGAVRDATTHRRVQGLVAGRLFVATILFGGTLALGGADLSSSALTQLVLGIYAASLLSLVWLERGKALGALVVTQIAIDLATASILVWLTGGAASTFSFLYGVVILGSAMIAGPRTAATTSGLAGVLYLAIGVAIATGWISTPSASAPLESGELGVALLRNAVGLFLVGILASVLSERLRRTGGELERVAASAAGYARLNEDILRSLSSGLITTDLEGRVQTINAAGARMLGDPAQGAPLDRILPVAEAPSRAEILASRPDGARFPVGYTRTPLIDEEGRVRGSLVLFQDLTEITQLRDKAEKVERLAVLGRLAAGLAHEIRNPLGSISGSVELVRDAVELGEEDRKLLGMVVSEVDRLNELVTTMLEVGRPVAPERADVELRSLAGEVVEVARRGPSAAAGVDVRLSPGAPVHVHADPAQLRQVLWNLIKNAVQFSPRGSAVTVGIRSADGSAIVEVVDRGPGIAEEDRAHLFELFYSKRRHGIGLGLALVKQIVDAHGGTVGVESTAEGSTFRVTLAEAGGDRR